MLKFILASLAVIVLAFASLWLYGTFTFDARVSAEADDLYAQSDWSIQEAIGQEKLEQLPEPVLRWLTFSKLSLQNNPRGIQIDQQGYLRQSAEQAWLSFHAREYLITAAPARIWYATIKIGPLFTMTERDYFAEGEGHVLMKMLSLFTIIDSTTPELGSEMLLRYLASIVWMPYAALSNSILWEEADENSALATLIHQGRSVSAHFYFDGEGRVLRIVSRTFSGDGVTGRENWSMRLEKYTPFNGVMLPSGGICTWHLPSGDFDYFDLLVTDVLPVE